MELLANNRFEKITKRHWLFPEEVAAFKAGVATQTSAQNNNIASLTERCAVNYGHQAKRVRDQLNWWPLSHSLPSVERSIAIRTSAKGGRAIWDRHKQICAQVRKYVTPNYAKVRQ